MAHQVQGAAAEIRWVGKVGKWMTIGLAVIALYFAAFPVLVFYYIEGAASWRNTPKMDAIIEATDGPLNWLYDRSELYADYILWVDDQF